MPGDGLTARLPAEKFMKLPYNTENPPLATFLHTKTAKQTAEPFPVLLSALFSDQIAKFTELMLLPSAAAAVTSFAPPSLI